jgi:hypothetical protein
VVGPISAITIYWPCCADTVKTVTTPQDTSTTGITYKNTDNSLALLRDNSNKNSESQSQCDSSNRSNNNDDLEIL